MSQWLPATIARRTWEVRKLGKLDVTQWDSCIISYETLCYLSRLLLMAVSVCLSVCVRCQQVLGRYSRLSRFNYLSMIDSTFTVVRSIHARALLACHRHGLVYTYLPTTVHSTQLSHYTLGLYPSVSCLIPPTSGSLIIWNKHHTIHHFLSLPFQT